MAPTPGISSNTSRSNRRRIGCEPLGEGRTRYTSDDTITGILAPLVMLVYGRPMQKGFESACTARKRRAEELAAPERAPR
jgi:hypothetical protein